MQVYKGLKDDLKKSFVDTYDKMKAEGKHKDFKWVQCFQEEHVQGRSSSSGYKEGMFYGHQILAMNGFNHDNMPSEKVDVILRHLPQESMEKFGFDAEKIDHPLPELVKYKYVFDEQKEKFEEERNTFKIDREMGPKMMQAIQESKTGLGIKLENPDHHKLVQNCRALAAAKNSLAKQLNIAQDLVAVTKAKAAKGEFLQTDADGIAASVSGLAGFLQECRENITLAELLDTSSLPEELKAMSNKLEKQFQDAKIHEVGIKDRIKQVRKKLE